MGDPVAGVNEAFKEVVVMELNRSDVGCATGWFARTIKSSVLVPVNSPMVTVIFPLVEPAGTVVVILVVVEAVTTAVVPLNFTKLLAGVALK